MKTLFYNGRILTMAEPMYAEAVLIDDGRICAVGSLTELKNMAGNCHMEDLQGKTMLPAFIDPHSHFFQVAASFLQASVNGCTGPQQMGEKIRAFLSQRRIPKGQWIHVRDYDNNLMPGLCHPTLRELDSIAPENPMIIHHKSGHMGLMNSLALNALGITPQTKVPEGGMIQVQDGKLTGYMEENAFFECLQKAPMFDPQQLLSAFGDAQKKYASYGIVTLQDGMVSKPMLPMYRMLLEQASVYLDIKLYAGLDTYDDLQSLLKEFPGNRRIQCAGLKMFLDGSPQGRTAWMRTPYQGDDPDYCGYGTMTDDAVKDAFRMAADKNTQIIAHCNGDGASEQFLCCLEQVSKEKPNLKDLRPVIIHGQLLGVDQLKRVKDLHAMISFFVAHVYHWGDVHIRNFGMERASQISPARSAMESGIPITFHQDAPVIEPDMLETLWCAVNRETRDGVLLGENQRISVLDALKAVTVNAAYQYSEEDRRGALQAGMAADLVILDRDPLAVAPKDLRNLQVLKTYKAGNLVYQKENM